MPARSRKGGFNLLSSPQPIIDDDDETQTPAAGGAASPLPKPQVVPEPEPEELKVEAALKPSASKPARPSRRRSRLGRESKRRPGPSG